MWRSMIAGTVAAGLLAGLSATAFAAEPGKGGTIRERVLQRFDKNGNGKLDPDEMAEAKAAMDKLRGAGAGLGAPGKPGAAGGQPGAGRPSREEVLKKFDKNGNGRLDPEEFAAARAAMSKGPGAGTRPGGAGQPGAGRPGREELLKKFDKNGNGKLDPEEIAAARDALQKGRPTRRPQPPK